MNPDHLEPVTTKENSRRGIGGKLGAERNKAKTHCPQGHPYDEANTYVQSSRYGGTNRICRTCRRDAAARRRQDPAYRERQRVARKARGY